MEYFKSHISGLNFLDLSAVQYPAHHRWLSPPDSSASFNGFKVKVFALYAAPYEEVLLIDSDSMPLMDPTLFFEQQAYLQHGNLFWPDRWCTAVRLFGHLGMDDGGGKLPQADSGQLFIDRKRYAAVLEWLLFLNTHDEFTYRYAHGDKDTFRAAFHMAGHGASYFQVPQPLSVALAPGLIYPTPRGFVQHHPNGSLAFVHRTSKAKYSSRELGGRAFSYLLLQPDCHWSERHWHFFTPMASVRRSRVVPSNKCNYSLYDPTAALQSCKGRPRHTSQPPVLEVAAGSYVGQAQAAADESHAAFMEYVQTYAGEQRRQQGWPPLAVFAFVFAVIIALGGSVAVLLRCCRPLRQATMAGTIPKTLKV